VHPGLLIMTDVASAGQTTIQTSDCTAQKTKILRNTRGYCYILHFMWLITARLQLVERDHCAHVHETSTCASGKLELAKHMAR
jgi:hypothetical protein